MDTDMTSDVLIYNTLITSDDPFIKGCNIKFIDESVPAMEDDTIYIANVSLESLNEFYESTQYRATVNIYVKTKDTDYIEASRFLRSVVKRIKQELKRNEECKARRITFRQTSFEYGSKYTLKGLHLLAQMVEYERYPDEKEPDRVCEVKVDGDIIIE